MTPRPSLTLTRRRILAAAGVGMAGVGAVRLGLLPWPGSTDSEQARPGKARYFPPSELDGGWRIGDPRTLGVNPDRLREALRYHDESPVTTSHGGALVVIHQGHIIGERYVTGTEGGPESWTARTCNDMKSSTKSVFGTAVGVFLDEYRDQVTLESDLVGASRDASLIPQIWEQPISDPRKIRIKVKHVLSMTSGHESREPWLAPSPRRLSPGYRGPYQMHEYCFGWWQFEGIPAQHTLKFEPGTDFNYSNFGMEQLALAMRNLSGEEVGPYVYDRVLGPIGMPVGLRNNQYREMPYADDRELNFSADAGWGRGGSDGCNAYGADGSTSDMGFNSIVGSTFRCTARDFARLAYLWLSDGRWHDQQLVPKDWLRAATRRFVRDNGETPNNYGYSFWTYKREEGVPEDLFMSRGHNMNHGYVVPSLDLVVVRQGNDNRRQVDKEPFATALIQKIVAAFDA
ncbi:MAG: serine hydrolase [Acidobacteria bacterium]|nr:serine hydrolase [Acidobacteriota bacterium]